MIRWSCQRLHGCVPVEASATPCASTRAPSCARRSTIRSAASPTPLWYLKRLQQPVRNALPAPPVDRRAARRLSERATLVRRQREQGVELVRELAPVAGGEARERAVFRRVLRLEALGDLRKP